MGNSAKTPLQILVPGHLTCKGRGASATGQETPEGFVVHAGSFAAGTETKSLQPHVRARRADLIRNGVLAQDGDRLRFTRDHVFQTSSGAADVILARSSAGPADWKDQNGRTLKQFHESHNESRWKAKEGTSTKQHGAIREHKSNVNISRPPTNLAKLDQERVDALAEAELMLFHCDFCPHLELKELLQDRTPWGRRQFRTLFSNFYGMHNAGLTEEFADKYFEILFEGVALRDGKPEYEGLLGVLSGIKRRKGDYGMPFSFVSKLVAMHLDDRPIFDRHVLAFFGGKTPCASVDKQERIGWFVCFLNHVRSSYQAWARDERVQPILSRFKKRDVRLHDCDAVRLIDFLVWKVGNQKLLTMPKRG